MIPSHANGILRIVKAEIDLPWHGLLAWSTSFVDHADLANLMCTIHAVGTELVATATSLEGSKRELQIAHVLYSQSSANPENFVEIAPVDVEILLG